MKFKFLIILVVLLIGFLSLFFWFKNKSQVEVVDLSVGEGLDKIDNEDKNINPFQNKENWEAMNAQFEKYMNGAYVGAVSDGKYVYFVPRFSPHYRAYILRYDTEKPFKNINSFEIFDASYIDELDTRGYFNGVFDGKYVYFIPATNVRENSNLLRFDTTKNFKNKDSYQAFDISQVSDLVVTNYDDAYFDGHYIYFAPVSYERKFHANILRFDTKKDFKDKSSYQVFNASDVDGYDMSGIFDISGKDNDIYFLKKKGTDLVYRSYLMKFDKTKDFNDKSSYEVFDISNLQGLETTGYSSMVMTDNYLYLIPYSNENAHGLTVRYSLKEDFKNENSYEVFDLATIDGKIKGFIDGVFDGQYVYFSPYYNGEKMHSVFLRHDASYKLDDKESWSYIDLPKVDNLETRGYYGAVIINNNIYFSPFMFDEHEIHSNIVKYKITQ